MACIYTYIYIYNQNKKRQGRRDQRHKHKKWLCTLVLHSLVLSLFPCAEQADTLKILPDFLFILRVKLCNSRRSTHIVDSFFYKQSRKKKLLIQNMILSTSVCDLGLFVLFFLKKWSRHPLLSNLFLMSQNARDQVS